MNYDLYNENCINVLSRIGRQSVDLVITDPPYRLMSGGRSGLCMGGILDPSVYDNGGRFFDVPKFSEWVDLVHSVSCRDSEFYVMVNDKNMHEMMTIASSVGFKLHNILIWDKGNQTPNRWYMKRCEFILYFWKGRARKINNMGTSSLLSIPCKMGGRLHPTEKPVELMRVLVDNSTSESMVVLDPFMGIGSTGVACVQADRKFIGIELNDTYFQIASDRIKSAYGSPISLGPLFDRT